LLNFFRVNDPFRLLAVALYILGLGFLYYFLDPFGLTQTQLTWIVVGERAIEGFLPFKNIIDDTGPLSVGVFSLFEMVFGRNILAYEIAGRILILWQAIYWNLILLKYRVLSETSYLPAVLVVCLFHFSFDMLSLSPALLGSCFLLLSIGQLFSKTVLQSKQSESTLLIGLHAGLAFGFHPIFLVFLPYMIFAGVAISGFSFRELILSIIGFLLPALGIATFYFWNDGLFELFRVWPMSFFTPRILYQTLTSWGLLAIFPLILAGIGYFLCAVVRGSTINQQKQRQLLMLWLVVACFELFLIKDQAGFQLIVLIPTLSYLLTQFFHLTKRAVIANSLFFLLIFGLPIGAIFYWSSYMNSNPKYLISEKLESNPREGIMSLQVDMSPYAQKKLDGPFLDYEMSKVFNSKTQTLSQKAKLFQLLENQKSGVVLDPNGTFQEILKSLPALENQYRKEERSIFVLK